MPLSGSPPPDPGADLPRAGGLQRFADFEIDCDRRLLLLNGVPAAIGGRAFDVLSFLIEQRHRIVSKQELLDTVWPGLVVEENNLNVQISSLRKLLGAHVIATVSGRGYRFTGDDAAPAIADSRARSAREDNLPLREQHLFGREADLAAVMDQLEQGGCVTLCGSAGIGKTALAIQAARQLRQARRYRQGCWFVDLADVRDPSLFVAALCQATGVELRQRGDVTDELFNVLRHRHMLLVLDNCEHLIETVAALVTRLLAEAADVTVLATSQEPLRLRDERIVRLAPLAVPRAHGSEDLSDVRNSASMQVMLARIDRSPYRPAPWSAADLSDLAEICRQLDGIPLALEFAAARVPLLGAAGVRARLGDRLRLLSASIRDGPARHRSLHAALEWSFQLLSGPSQELMQALAVFPAGFSLEGAQVLLPQFDDMELVEHFHVLVERSMLSVEPTARPRYRMLETTRAFLLDVVCRRAEVDPGAESQPEREAAFVRVMATIVRDAARARDRERLWQEMPNVRSALASALRRPDLAEAAIALATFTAVELGTGGAIREGLDNLLAVQPLLNELTPLPLAARYFHWLGRLGIEGRLPTSRSVHALERAAVLFEQLGDVRRQHGCHRHLAETWLRAGDLARTQAHLECAAGLEADERTSPTDQLRRLRVQALLEDLRGNHEVALRHAQASLTLAETYGVERYRHLLMADMAWMLLQNGQFSASITSLQELLLHIGPRQGLARVRVLTVLTAAHLAAGQLGEARAGGPRLLASLRQSNLVATCYEILAWLCLACADWQTAAQLLGASKAFRQRSQTECDPVATLARRRAMDELNEVAAVEDIRYWEGVGLGSSEPEMAALVSVLLDARPSAMS